MNAYLNLFFLQKFPIKYFYMICLYSGTGSGVGTFILDLLNAEFPDVYK